MRAGPIQLKDGLVMMSPLTFPFSAPEVGRYCVLCFKDPLRVLRGTARFKEGRFSLLVPSRHSPRSHQIPNVETVFLVKKDGNGVVVLCPVDLANVRIFESITGYFIAASYTSYIVLSTRRIPVIRFEDSVICYKLLFLLQDPTIFSRLL